MKRTLFLLTLLLMTSVYAAPKCPVSRFQQLPHVSGKTILAGGAAAGTIIAAYKVSNGIEKSLTTIAKDAPETFPATARTVAAPFYLGGFILILCVGYGLLRKQS